MSKRFFKYQGTGNDFIMLNGFEGHFHFTPNEILKICHRRFGIGADGLIILKPKGGYDFEMDYYNADGTQSFCGNGSRCAQAFAKQLGLIKEESSFYAIDGAHQGKYDGQWFSTKMGDVSEIQEIGEDLFINTGSPHYIQFVDDVNQVDVYAEGKAIRNRDTYKAEGTNVNFVSYNGNELEVRTYERGVEDETYSCGTGVTAAAIAYLYKQGLDMPAVEIKTKGGDLRIELKKTTSNSYQDIWLCGPAEFVFEGDLN